MLKWISLSFEKNNNKKTTNFNHIQICKVSLKLIGIPDIRLQRQLSNIMRTLSIWQAFFIILKTDKMKAAEQTNLVTLIRNLSSDHSIDTQIP